MTASKLFGPGSVRGLVFLLLRRRYGASLLRPRQPLVELCDFFLLVFHHLLSHRLQLRRLAVLDFDLGHLDGLLMVHPHHGGEVLVGISCGLHALHLLHPAHHRLVQLAGPLAHASR